MSDNINLILKLIDTYIIYFKLICITLILVFFVFKKEGPVFKRFKLKFLFFLFYVYILFDFLSSLAVKYYFYNSVDKIHGELYHKIDINEVNLSTEIKTLSAKIDDNFNIKNQKDTTFINNHSEKIDSLLIVGKEIDHIIKK